MHLAGFSPDQIFAIVVAASFAAGLNVYATVATLGLLGHFEVVQLPGSLHEITHWWVIAIAAVLFLIELFADKVPAFDLIWNALHTFIRVPVAAVMGYAATSHLEPRDQLIAAVLAGLIALVAHSGKTAVRAAVTPSPEPFSNIALSVGEDAIAIGLTWFATQHPYVAAAIALVLVVILVLMVRMLWRAMKALFRKTRRLFATA